MELIWEGKYDEEGRRAAPPRAALPFETVEAYDRPAEPADGELELFPARCRNDQPNRLIWGDKSTVLPSLLHEFAGTIDLIYIDPPFDTGADHYFSTRLGDAQTPSANAPGAMAQKAYRDTWGKGPDSYLQWLYETVVLLRELLSEHGSIYLHLDWRVGHYAKAVMDEVFGTACFQNELAWCYREAINSSKRWNRKHDNILFYTKDPATFTFNANAVLNPHSEATRAKYKRQDETGRYRLMGRGIAGSPVQSARDVSPEWEAAHPELVYRQYLRAGSYPVDYLNIDIINQASHERLNYPTQKPEALLERILKASSNEGDLVLDCFCGSGTTAAVAEKLGRRWVACDLGRFAVHAARKRLLGIEGVRPFVVQSLGGHERLAWQAGFGGDSEECVAAYRGFVLELYGAHRLPDQCRLHGERGGRAVHVGEAGAPITEADIRRIAAECASVAGGAETWTGVDVLGWDFSIGAREAADRQAELSGVGVRLVRIPREALDPRAVARGDIRFFGLPAISARAAATGMAVTLTLTGFEMPPEDVPEEARNADLDWERYVDYWAVDWSDTGGVFRNQWRAHRTRKRKTPATTAEHIYDEPGVRRIAIRVVDIYGNETAQELTVSVPG